MQRQHANPLAQTLAHPTHAPQGAALTTIIDTTAGHARATAWDRAAIAGLGLTGFALSYDALRQMAVAVHVRGALSFLFPLLIDGFIAYGIRALLVLRTAPPAARVYVWALFGSATGASIWANALHAVRINQQTNPGDDPGLRMGDTTVGILSTLAPLALAGAVHLYILIARQPASSASDRPAMPGHPSRTGDPVTDRMPTATVNGDAEQTELALAGPEATVFAAESDRATAEDDLLPAARRAVADGGRITRAIVANALRDQGRRVSNERLTDLMRTLRDEGDAAAKTPART
ncbi:DUF2637 domain-containing protein [Embleya sp. NPDC020630]|uniref:DUF2637 domain-containing protein n=1 Tax=Embleya sp. NPDC020630 TaxID=3363979 RepID=UPI0037B1FED9